ncbi:MAG: NADH-quinone oxidoreductase subunit H [Actinobacteria bacterium]|nr:NADH-quinone oxidoreductase subunit H [Actinomycetota bacterium]
MAVALQVLQSLVVVALAPLYVGAMARAEAIVSSKRGPSVLQPYYDLAKLLRKGAAVSDQASWVYQGAPFVVFACYLTVSVIVPIITNPARGIGQQHQPDCLGRGEPPGPRAPASAGAEGNASDREQRDRHVVGGRVELHHTIVRLRAGVGGSLGGRRARSAVSIGPKR